MTKRTRGVSLSVSIVGGVAAPLLIGLLAAAAASCGGGVSNGPSGSGGGTPSGAGSLGTGGGMSRSASAASSSGSGGAGGAVPMPCMGDADCANNPAGNVCDTSTGNCVGCLPANDTCPQGQYCNPMTNDCSMGCKDDADCGGMNTHCDPTTHLCVGCVVDADCPLGTLCAGGTCASGCTPAHGCPGSENCCSGACADLSTSLTDCGGCGKICPVPDNSAPSCAGGMCGMGACSPGWSNCDASAMNGCEWNVLLDGPCACVPGTTQACYNGAPGTKGVGPCKAGTATCNAMGTGWGPCAGEVLPQPELCNNAIDEDCSGVLDDATDLDGDGWNACNGDCCETLAQCASPALVNPGAFEFLNNGINDDCDAATSDTVAPAPCIASAKFSGVTALDVAHAMDICQSTTANPPLPMKKWGIISAQHLLADGSVPTAAQLTDMQSKQTAILQNYGTGGIVPKKGPTMAGISSGTMRDENDAGYIAPNGGTSLTTGGMPPAAYLAAHNGNLPSSAGCSGNCPAGTGANDSVNIRLTIRVPTNAKSFSYDFRFFSAEYWTYQCTTFNDFYLALLQTGNPMIPPDHNISFDALKNPISVNNGFFDVCPVKGCNTCPGGTGPLAGTGMEVGSTGGGTYWLTTDVSIVPGETMQLELMVFDVSDHILDSLAILDNFRWSIAPAVLGTHQ